MQAEKVQLYQMRRQNHVLSALREIKRLLCSEEAHNDHHDIRTQIPAKRCFCINGVCSPVVNQKMHQLLLLSTQPEVQVAVHENVRDQDEIVSKSQHLGFYQPLARYSCSTLPLFVKSPRRTKTKWTWTIKPKTITCTGYEQFSQSSSFFTQGGRRQCVGLLSGVHQPVMQHRRFLKAVKVQEEAVMSTEEIKRALVEWDMKHEQGFTCFITKCPRLAQPNKKSTPGVNSNQLFINMTTGKWAAVEPFYGTKHDVRILGDIKYSAELLLC